MIGPLVRWFGRAAPRRSRRDAGPARRFTPRLEVLEGRALPAVHFGAGAPVGVTAQAAPLVADVGGGADVVTVLGTNGGGDGLSGGTEVTPFGVRIGTTGTGDGDSIALGGEVTPLHVWIEPQPLPDHLGPGNVTPLGGQLGEGGGGSPGRVIQPGLDPGTYSTLGSQVPVEPPGGGSGTNGSHVQEVEPLPVVGGTIIIRVSTTP